MRPSVGSAHPPVGFQLSSDSSSHILVAFAAVLLPLMTNAVAFSPAVRACFVCSLAFAPAPLVLGHRGTSRAFCAVICLFSVLNLCMVHTAEPANVIYWVESFHYSGVVNLGLYHAGLGLWLGSRPAAHVSFNLRSLTAAVFTTLLLVLLIGSHYLIGGELAYALGLVDSGLKYHLAPFVAGYVAAEARHLQAPASQWRRTIEQQWAQADHGFLEFLANCFLVAFFSFWGTLLLVSWAREGEGSE